MILDVFQLINLIINFSCQLNSLFYLVSLVLRSQSNTKLYFGSVLHIKLVTFSQILWLNNEVAAVLPAKV